MTRDSQREAAAKVLQWMRDNPHGHGFHEVPGGGLVHVNDGRESYFATAEEADDTEDMAAVGRSLMERIAIHLDCPADPLYQWAPADDPAEVVGDLVAMVEDLRKQLAHAKADVGRLDLIQGEYLRIDPFPIPTGGGDADVGWEACQYHQGEAKPRVIATVYNDDLRAALDMAAATLGYIDRASEETDTCAACGIQFRDGDAYYHEIGEGGYIHADCCGPERESYCDADGEPLAPDALLPEHLIWGDEPRITGAVNRAGGKEGAEGW